MIHLPPLILDLGIILMTAAAVTLLFRYLKQPVVLGYLVAGFFVGPHFTVLPTVRDAASITVWAEIGVIFLLFGLGLEFSFKKLMRVGKSASISAGFEVVSMLGIGYLTGRLIGWSTMDSLFLGGILSISSTTIIVRAFDELGLKGRHFASLVFGILIVEDLVAILLLVLLSSVAVTQSLSGSELAFSSLRLGFFLVLWFLLGIYLLPIVLRKIRLLLSDETTLIVSIALCLMMVMTATAVGFSPALGAFVMGSILAETREGHRIEKLLLPVKDLFAAVFFVSVGMLIDPAILAQYWPIILLLTVLTIIGKFLSSGIGALVSGESLKNSVKTGMSLAQIGEFSFIIATLGMTLKVTSDFLYPIAVAVSAITTFTTPYLIRFSEPACDWIDRRLSERVRNGLTNYSAAMNSPTTGGLGSLLGREYGVKIALNAVVVIAIALVAERIPVPETLRVGVALLAFVVSTPFLWAVTIAGPAHTSGYPADSLTLLRRLQPGISFVRYLIGAALVGFIVSRFFSPGVLGGIVLVLLAAPIVTFGKLAAKFYRGIESRFLANLTENERAELEKAPKVPNLAPWDATLAPFVVTADSPVVGQTLAESRLKERFGVTVTMIERGRKRILAPKRDDQLLPQDRLFMIGNDAQLASVRAEIEYHLEEELLPPVTESFGLTSILASEKDAFVGKVIRDCGLREAVDGLIVGIERAGTRILSPDSGMTLQTGDLIWIVGDRTRIKALRDVK